MAMPIVVPFTFTTIPPDVPEVITKEALAEAEGTKLTSTF